MYQKNKPIGYCSFDIHKESYFINHMYVNDSSKYNQFITFMLMHLKEKILNNPIKRLIYEVENKNIPLFNFNEFFKLGIDYKVPSFTNDNKLLSYNLCIWDERGHKSIPNNTLRKIIKDIFKIGYNIESNSEVVKNILNQLKDK